MRWRREPPLPTYSWPVCFADETLAFIDEHAERFGVEREDVIDRALSLLRFWSDGVGLDESLAILSPDGSVRRATPVWSDQIQAGLGERQG